jgi:hypothetical protein
MLHLLNHYATQDECSFTLSLFFQPEHLRWQSARQAIGFAWQSNDNSKWQALAYFWLENQQATSPLAASFGGFDFDNELSDKQLFAFVEAVFCWLKTQQIHAVQIIQAPVCYQVHYPRLQKVLAFFSTNIISETNQHLAISDIPFAKIINPAAKRRLNKCEKEHFFLEINPQKLNEQYDFIQKERLAKGIPLTITKARFLSLFESFPESFLPFTLYHNHQIIATCTAVIVVPQQIIYYFLPANSLSYKPFSPSILLIKYLYKYAQLHQYKILDLGISSVNGILNENLFRFKKNLGAITTTKQQGYFELLND